MTKLIFIILHPMEQPYFSIEVILFYSFKG